MERYELTLNRITKDEDGDDSFEEVISVRGGARVVLGALAEIGDEVGATTAGDPFNVAPRELHAPVSAVSIPSEALQDAPGFAGAAATALAPPAEPVKRTRRTKQQIAEDKAREEQAAAIAAHDATRSAEVAPPPAAEAWPADASTPGAPAAAVHVPPAPAVAGPPPGFNPFG